MSKELSHNSVDKSIQDKKQSCSFKDDLIANIFDNIAEGIVIVNQQYMIITANRAYCNQIQKPLQDIIGSYCYEIAHKTDKPCYEYHEICSVKEVFKTGRSCAAIHTHYNKYNEPVLVKIKSYPVKEDSGKIVFAILFIENITDKDNLEKELKDSEEKFQTICLTAQDSIIIIDDEGKITYWNLASEKIFGYSAQEIHGKLLHSLIAPERFYERYKKGFDLFKHTGDGPAIGKTLELYAVRKDGSEFPIELSLSAVKIRGKYNAIGFVRDITERKHTEEKLKRDYYMQKTIKAILEFSIEPVSLEKQLNKIIDLILAIPWLSLQSKGCVFLTKGRTDILRLKVHRGFSKSHQDVCGKVPFGICICGKAASERKLIFTDSITDEHSLTYQGMTSHGHYCIPIISKTRILGVICLYVEEGYHRNKDDEIFLLAIANTAAGIIERKQIETELEAQKRALEDRNTALKVLLEQREKDKEDLKANVLSNVKNLIFPAIEKINTSPLSPQQKSLIDLIEKYTKDIVSPFINKLSSSYFDLTSTEIKIASLIKEGKTTKEIAELLALSENTIMTHRYKLRSKLGLKNEKTSLYNYLQFLD